MRAILAQIIPGDNRTENLRDFVCTQIIEDIFAEISYGLIIIIIITITIKIIIIIIIIIIILIRETQENSSKNVGNVSPLSSGK